MTINLDLHVHTSHSPCAMLRPADIETVALKRGLDGVAVTDHNTLAGALAVRELAKKIKVIVGEEVKTARGEIIGYFLTEFIPPFLSPQETLSRIRRQGGLVSIPHPLDRLRSSRLDMDVLEKILPDIDMIESYNSRDILTAVDRRILDRAAAMDKLLVAASDAHLKIEVGRSYVSMADFSGPGDFLGKLKQGVFVKRKSPFWVHLVTKVLKTCKKKEGSR